MVLSHFLSGLDQAVHEPCDTGIPEIQPAFQQEPIELHLRSSKPLYCLRSLQQLNLDPLNCLLVE
jgi:hypothetical protein